MISWNSFLHEEMKIRFHILDSNNFRYIVDYHLIDRLDNKNNYLVNLRGVYCRYLSDLIEKRGEYCIANGINIERSKVNVLGAGGRFSLEQIFDKWKSSIMFGDTFSFLSNGGPVVYYYEVLSDRMAVLKRGEVFEWMWRKNSEGGGVILKV